MAHVYKDLYKSIPRRLEQSAKDEIERATKAKGYNWRTEEEKRADQEKRDQLRAGRRERKKARLS
jgi:hypothetical protein